MRDTAQKYLMSPLRADLLTAAIAERGGTLQELAGQGAEVMLSANETSRQLQGIKIGIMNAELVFIGGFQCKVKD